MVERKMHKISRKMRNGIMRTGKHSYSIQLSTGRDPVTGKRIQQWISFKGTLKEAQQKRNELVHQINTGSFMRPGKTTLADYLERWLKDYAWTNLAPRTAEGYEHIIRQHLIPSLGNLTLIQIKPEHLQHYYSDKISKGRLDGKGGLSAKTVRHHHITLHTALETAKKWGLLLHNPADNTTPPVSQHHEIQTWDEYEIKTFLEAARESQYYTFFYLALFTGMRRSELLALRWQDVNLLIGQIYVSRSLHHLRDGKTVIRQPKTTKGRRTVALPPTASLVLRDHRMKQEQDNNLLNRNLTNDDFVFCHPDHTPLLPDSVTHAWNKILNRTSLKHIRLHDSRHSHASLLLKRGVHPKIVQERLGHANIQITLDTYSHVAPGLQEAAAVQFDEAISPIPQPMARN